MKKILILFLLFNLVKPIFAEDLYPLQNSQQQKQFSYLTQQLRCLVCQNEAIADSNAALAADLRQTVYKMVQEGHSNEEIKQYMIARYGHFIWFTPPWQKSTYFLWLAPFILLLLGFFCLFKVILGYRGKS